MSITKINLLLLSILTF